MIRPFCQADIPEIFKIEKAVHVVPWTVETFAACFTAGYSGWLIEVEQKIIGFIIVSFSHDECHILNLCVIHSFQRQGYGRQLMDFVLNHAKGRGMSILYLEVRRSNSRAISLYEKMGFAQIGERKGYYPTVVGEEDALVFAISLKQG